MQEDEIKQYLDARWLGDAEAMYCLFVYHTHKEWPPIEMFFFVIQFYVQRANLWYTVPWMQTKLCC